MSVTELKQKYEAETSEEEKPNSEHVDGDAELDFNECQSEYLIYRDSKEWVDLEPVSQDDGTNPVVKIYSERSKVPHGREMSTDLRKKIISLHEKGEGYKKIGKALLISQNTVAKVIQKFKKDGTFTSQKRPGRPRKLSPRQECLLIKKVEKNCYKSSLQLAKDVENQTGVTVSSETIRRILQKNGMRWCRP